ncbi:histidinol-phosphate transaminase [Chloroflexota bacterium]
MSLQPRSAVTKIKTAEHGGYNYSELRAIGVLPEEVLDFSVSLSPLGAPQGVCPTVKGSKVALYPDSGSSTLKRCLSKKLGVGPKNLLVGNGSTEIIRLAALTYLDSEDKALIIEPTYAEYEASCAITGVSVMKLTMQQNSNGFKYDLHAIIAAIEEHKPKAIFICNPNNPTGNYISRDQFEQIASAATDSLIVLDEAYVSFVNDAWNAIEILDKYNLLIVRSMTKDYALAGLRVGYGIANEQIIDAMQRVCPPWNVNMVAQHAAVLALQQNGHIEKSREMAYKNKSFLTAELSAMGFECMPSDANFFLIDVKDASQFKGKLLAKKILVRDCTSFGLPNYIRIAPKSIKKCKRLIEAIRELKDES